MPSLITLGATSGRGFGATNPVLPPVLTTTTFTSSGNWVAPSSVSNVASIYGYGQDGSPTPASANTQYWTFDWPGTKPNPPYAQWADLYSAATTARSAFVACIGGLGPSNVLMTLRYYIGVGSTWEATDTNYEDFSAYIVNSVDPVSVGNGSPQTSGNIVYPPGYNSWVFTIYLTAPGFQGASSTGLGKTFPGGNGGPPSTTTFSNVAVTPGVSYAISVAPGGSVTLQYYV